MKGWKTFLLFPQQGKAYMIVIINSITIKTNKVYFFEMNFPKTFP